MEKQSRKQQRFEQSGKVQEAGKDQEERFKRTGKIYKKENKT